MLKTLKNLFDFNAKQVARIQKTVDSITALEPQVQKLTNAEFKTETEKLKKQIQEDGKKIDEVLPYAFALVREASFRRCV